MNDLVGKKFGRLLVKKFSHIDKGHHSCWHVECECGKNKIVHGFNIEAGNIKSCGCLRNELLVLRSIKHGYGATPIYHVWASMRQRCNSQNAVVYKYYGGRGIRICDRWLNSFENFYADMGEKPEGMSIERIDNDGDYEPDNCYWSTHFQQSRNMRSNKYITFNGKTLCHVDWSRLIGGGDNLVYQRLKLGWSEERAISVPVKRYIRK